MALAELQGLADRASDGQLRLRDPVWVTAFHLHHRHAVAYRAGRVFLAGDAAHIHSPAGAQGMNTGIQDATNLGWKLGLVATGCGPEELLASYDAERRPVGDFVLRFTDRAFTAATSTNPVVRLMRTELAPRLLPLAARFRPGRAAVFRTISELGVSYRHSPAVAPGPRWSIRRPQPGDRLPDAPITRNGVSGSLHELLNPTAFRLLVAGPANGWNQPALAALAARHGCSLAIYRIDRHPGPGVLGSEIAWRRLHVRDAAHLVVRPDGHVGYRADHRDLVGAERYLDRWLTAASRESNTSTS